jgi:hypothetical protein
MPILNDNHLDLETKKDKIIKLVDDSNCIGQGISEIFYKKFIITLTDIKTDFELKKYICNIILNGSGMGTF